MRTELYPRQRHASICSDLTSPRKSERGAVLSDCRPQLQGIEAHELETAALGVSEGGEIRFYCNTLGQREQWRDGSPAPSLWLWLDKLGLIVREVLVVAHEHGTTPTVDYTNPPKPLWGG